MREFTMNGTLYRTNESGNYFYKSTGKTDKKGNPIMMRISQKVFDEAWEQSGEAEKAKRAALEAKKDAEAEKAMNKVSKPRKSKDIAFTTTVTLADDKIADVTLTAKQVDFIKHIPDTCFYEHGLESTPWCDVLADEIGGQFAGKPMTVGAMLSTLREKDIIAIGKDRVNGKVSKFFWFTELGKQVAKELGLN